MAARVGTGQSGTGDGAAATIAAGAMNTTTGNCLTVAVKWEQSASTLSSITDTAGNTWVIVSQAAHANGVLRSAIAYALNITGNASNVVTANFSDGNPEWRRIVVEEWSGIATSDALDDSDIGTGTGTTYSTAALSTTTAGLVFGQVSGYTALTGKTAGGSPAFTLANTTPSDTFGVYYISASGQTVTPGASANESDAWLMKAIALKDAGGGGGSTATTAWLRG